MVAKTFKVCGIMENNDTSCTSYFPGNFGSAKWTVPISEGIKVVEERTIVKKYEDEVEAKKTEST